MMPIAHFGNKARKRLRFDKNGYKLSKYFLLAHMDDLIRNYYDVCSLFGRRDSRAHADSAFEASPCVEPAPWLETAWNRQRLNGRALKWPIDTPFSCADRVHSSFSGQRCAPNRY
jgi:hypothetical protein